MKEFKILSIGFLFTSSICFGIAIAKFILEYINSGNLIITDKIIRYGIVGVCFLMMALILYLSVNFICKINNRGKINE